MKQQTELRQNPKFRFTSRNTDNSPGLYTVSLMQEDGTTRPDGDGLLYVPSKYQEIKPAPLVTLLHGANGSSGQMISAFFSVAEELGIILLAMDSTGATWDLIRHGAFLDDEAAIDRAIRDTQSKFQVDNNHSALLGFSDGASYALSLGLSGDLTFSHLIAFSPGFLAPDEYRHHPKIFISHGRSDTTLNIDRCSRKILSQLKASGVNPYYTEFEGGHSLSPFIIKEAMTWFLNNEAARRLDPSIIDSRSQGIERT